MANERDRTPDMDDETMGGAGSREDTSPEQLGGRSEENLRGTADDEDDEFDETDDLDDEEDEESDGTI